MRIAPFAVWALILGLGGWAAADEDERRRAPQSFDAERLAVVRAAYVKNVEPMFQAKCAHCHVADPDYPWYVVIPGLGSVMRHHNEEGREDLDFTDGFPFKGKGGLAKQLDEIEEEVLFEREMPPLYYKITHPTSGLSDAEESKLKAWLALARGELGLAQGSERERH